MKFYPKLTFESNFFLPGNFLLLIFRTSILLEGEKPIILREQEKGDSKPKSNFFLPSYYRKKQQAMKKSHKELCEIFTKLAEWFKSNHKITAEDLRKRIQKRNKELIFKANVVTKIKDKNIYNSIAGVEKLEQMIIALKAEKEHLQKGKTLSRTTATILRSHESLSKLQGKYLTYHPHTKGENKIMRGVLDISAPVPPPKPLTSYPK